MRCDLGESFPPLSIVSGVEQHRPATVANRVALAGGGALEICNTCTEVAAQIEARTGGMDHRSVIIGMDVP
jgi:hypothetical protein